MFLAKIETSSVFDFAFKGLFLALWLFKRYFSFCSFQGCGRGVLGVVLVDLRQGFGRFLSFFEKYSSKHLEGTEILYTFALALQNKPSGKLLKAVKKEFFEKIYINREVVQEASV